MTAEDTLAGHADTAAEAVRRINHLTIFGPPIPAPELYPVVGSLARLGYGLRQALDQLNRALQLSAGAYDLYEADPDRDPALSLTRADIALSHAAYLAGQLGNSLDNAQTAIAGQGYRTTDPNGDHR